MSDDPKQSETSNDESGSPDEPKITLDRYLSRRRPPPRSSWGAITSMVFMLIALVLIFVFKDRCGDMAAQFVGGGGAPSDQPAEKQQKP